jgi:hypothetical protein
MVGHPFIYFSTKGTIIKKLPLKLMRDENSKFASFLTNTVGAKFNAPSNEHQEQIKQYISRLT